VQADRRLTKIDGMRRRVRLAARSIALVGALLACASLVRSQDEAGDLARVVEALALTPGSLVAEIGAGDGALTLGLARHIGASGHVFTTELGDSPVQALRSAVGASGLSQIEVVEGGPTSTNLVES